MVVILKTIYAAYKKLSPYFKSVCILSVVLVFALSLTACSSAKDLLSKIKPDDTSSQTVTKNSSFGDNEVFDDWGTSSNTNSKPNNSGNANSSGASSTNTTSNTTSTTNTGSELFNYDDNSITFENDSNWSPWH